MSSPRRAKVHSLWRIATERADSGADDLSGKGGELAAGRWNRLGTPMVYSSMTISLACLETVVHLKANSLPLNRYLVEILVPDEVWKKAIRLDKPNVGWDACPQGITSYEHGESWVRARSSAIMFVPSVVVPEEFNAIINPRHPDAGKITAKKIRKWLYDQRLKDWI